MLAHLFELSQSQANALIHELSAILTKALASAGHIPPRLTGEMLTRLAAEGVQNRSIDGTERRVNRPLDNLGQRLHYSGKKAHTVKNTIVGGLADRQVKYLGATHEGTKHDKKIALEEKTAFPDGTVLYRDLGFQGLELANVIIHQPTKKPRKGKLSDEDKAANRAISSIRVVIEHIISGIKRCRIVKDIFRNNKEACDDTVIELACGLHNFRSFSRNQSY